MDCSRVHSFADLRRLDHHLASFTSLRLNTVRSQLFSAPKVLNYLVVDLVPNGNILLAKWYELELEVESRAIPEDLFIECDYLQMHLPDALMGCLVRHVRATKHIQFPRFSEHCLPFLHPALKIVEFAHFHTDPLPLSLQSYLNLFPQVSELTLPINCFPTDKPPTWLQTLTTWVTQRNAPLLEALTIEFVGGDTLTHLIPTVEALLKASVADTIRVRILHYCSTTETRQMVKSALKRQFMQCRGYCLTSNGVKLIITSLCFS